MTLPQPYSAQAQLLGPATTTTLLPPWKPRLDISTPGLGVSTSSASISSSRPGLELGAGQRSTSAQAEKFRARLEMTESVSKQSLPKRSPSADSLLTSQPAKPRPSMMEAVKAGLGGGTGGVTGIRSTTLPTSSRSSSGADDMTLKVQAALQSAKAAAVGGGDEIRSGTDTTGSVAKRPPAENAKEEAIRQRVKEQLKQAQEEAAAAAGT